MKIVEIHFHHIMQCAGDMNLERFLAAYLISELFEYTWDQVLVHWHTFKILEPKSSLKIAT